MQVVTAEEVEQFNKKCADRQGQIKAGRAHVWTQYHTYAWGADEMKPLSHSRNDNWGGMVRMPIYLFIYLSIELFWYSLQTMQHHRRDYKLPAVLCYLS